MNRKIIFGFCILFLLILFTGCLQKVETNTVKNIVKEESVPAKPSAAEPAQQAGSESYEDRIIEEFDKEKTEATEEEKEEKQDLGFMTGAAVAGLSEIDPRVAELVDKAKELKEFRYYYSESPDVHLKSQFFIKDEKVKIILPAPPAFARGKYYNAIYLDTKTKDAAAYCEDEKRCSDLNQEFPANYDDYYRLTPRDWALFVEDAEVLGTEVMYNRDTTLVEFEKGGRTYRIWLYNYHGLAAKVVEDYGASKPRILFFELISTHVSDNQI
ncbi:hypothetical protein KY335_01900, partial [Candidatus Woesearchaeota archaeon]|nr:hypothetical protein [Candidatus Woesearchaeota archaeon]